MLSQELQKYQHKAQLARHFINGFGYNNVKTDLKTIVCDMHHTDNKSDIIYLFSPQPVEALAESLG